MGYNVGQWLAERQDKLVTDLWKEQRQAQEVLVQGLCNVLREQSSTATGRGSGPSVQFRLSKLMSEDDIEAFLYAFEATVIATGWPKPQ